jgi:hypothetical protein
MFLPLFPQQRKLYQWCVAVEAAEGRRAHNNGWNGSVVIVLMW